MSTRTLQLVSSNGEIYQVSLEAARLSELIRSMVDDEEDSEQTVPLPNVNSQTLVKVIDFMNHYKEMPMIEIEKVSLKFFSLFFCLCSILIICFYSL